MVLLSPFKERESLSFTGSDAGIHHVRISPVLHSVAFLVDEDFGIHLCVDGTSRYIDLCIDYPEALRKLG